MSSSPLKVALIGNPNTGKTSVFNALTGLRQKVGNYPGITVEKKTGTCALNESTTVDIIDLPGTYSLNTTSLDESVAVEILLNKKNADHPDVIVVVAEVEHLKRNLLLFTQIKDLRIPTLLVINMADRMAKKGIEIDVETLEKELNTKVILVSTRSEIGIDTLKNQLLNYQELNSEPCTDITAIDQPYFDQLNTTFSSFDPYKLWLVITQDVNFMPIEKKPPLRKDNLSSTKTKAELKKLQHKETVLRYKFINAAISKAYVKNRLKAKGWEGDLDRILTNKFLGFIIFGVILLTIFQVIFDFSSIPMDAIDGLFAGLAQLIQDSLPAGVFTDLLSDGLIAGIGGVVIFIPQIAFLSFFIALLEESGYMSRVVFMMDRIMRPFGLSGKSIVPLMTGTACAIPAVMATRNIENWKDRLITILVVPFTTCSARLPVYLIIISLVIPNERFLGLGLQPLVLTLLYFLGFAMALLAAAVLNRVLKIPKTDFFMVEMPPLRRPQFKNVGITVFEKTKSFLTEAGRLILALSVIIWFLGSNGIGKDYKNAEQIVTNRIEASELNWTEEAVEQEISNYKLEHSFIGYMGKAIEPMVKPMGLDWKIGIALITSFAAREVFVGTLATIYSVDEEDQQTIRAKMDSERTSSGLKRFNLASGIAILLFYAFAMQCMSTLAIVKKETNSWKWPMLQLGAMTLIAYICAVGSYQLIIPYI